MQEQLISLIKKMLHWPQSRPYILKLLHRLGLHKITKKTYLLLRSRHLSTLSQNPNTRLATQDLMEQVQAELKNKSSTHAIVFLRKS
jgi:hypothetical protein